MDNRYAEVAVIIIQLWRTIGPHVRVLRSRAERTIVRAGSDPTTATRTLAQAQVMVGLWIFALIALTALIFLVAPKFLGPTSTPLWQMPALVLLLVGPAICAMIALDGTMALDLLGRAKRTLLLSQPTIQEIIADAQAQRRPLIVYLRDFQSECDDARTVRTVGGIRGRSFVQCATGVLIKNRVAGLGQHAVVVEATSLMEYGHSLTRPFSYTLSFYGQPDWLAKLSPLFDAADLCIVHFSGRGTGLNAEIDYLSAKGCRVLAFVSSKAPVALATFLSGRLSATSIFVFDQQQELIRDGDVQRSADSVVVTFSDRSRSNFGLDGAAFAHWVLAKLSHSRAQMLDGA